MNIFLNKKYVILIIIFFISFFSLFFINLNNNLIKNFKTELRILFNYNDRFINYKYISNNFIDLAKDTINSKIKTEKFSININYSDFEKIRKLRANSLKAKYLTDKLYVNSEIHYKNKIVKANVRLDGLFNDNWNNRKQWSLKFKLKENQSIDGFTSFTIGTHYSKQFPENQIISRLNSNFGVLSPKSRNIIVNVNGENWGLMNLEEDMSESFLELNQKKILPIFRIENIYPQLESRKIFKEENLNFKDFVLIDFFNKQKISITYNNPNKYKSNDYFKNIYSQFKTIILNLEDNKIKNDELNKYLDLNKFSFALMNALVFGTSTHGLQYQNMRFYYNKFTNKIEPIPRDNFYIRDLQDFYNYSNNITNLEESISDLENIFKQIKKTKEFSKIYDDYLTNYSAFENIIDKIIFDVCKGYGKSCEKSIDKQIIKKNYNFLKNKRTKEFIINYDKSYKSKNIKSFKISNEIYKKMPLHKFRIFNNGILNVSSLVNFKTKLQSLILKCTLNCDNTNKNMTIILNKEIDNYENIKISLDKNINFNKYDKVEIISGFESHFRSDEILLENYYTLSNMEMVASVEKFPNIIKLGNNYHLKSGVIIIDEPLILPKFSSLFIDPGTTILLNKQSYIYIDSGNININGSEDQKVNFLPLNKSWKGIFVKNSKNSVIKHMHISGLNETKNKNDILFLTGGVTFYNSNVIIDKIQINNSYSEDQINLINSKFEIKNSTFNNSISDAVDLDFSNGTIIDSFFSNIGGDAIDTSGSIVNFKNNKFYKIQDKAYSIGESSIASISDSIINEVGVGIVSKDSSIVKSINNKIENIKLAKFMAYNKKNFFEGGKLDIVDNNKNLDYAYSQNNSRIVHNGNVLPTIKINVKKLYSSSIMKKND